MLSRMQIQISKFGYCFVMAITGKIPKRLRLKLSKLLLLDDVGIFILELTVF